MKKGKHQVSKECKNQIIKEIEYNIGDFGGNSKKNEQNTKKIKRRKKNERKVVLSVTILLSIVLIVCIIYLFLYFLNSNKEKEEVGELLDSVEINMEELRNSGPEVTERMLKVRKLKEENPDIVAWIEIEGTNINYPVLQCDNNDFYVHRDYKKQESEPGSLFLDKAYDWTIPSSNLLIYGHNMKNGTMFGDLLNYKEESYFKEHSTIRFTTTEEDVTYEILAAFESRIYYKSEKNVFRYYQFVNAENEEQYNDYVKNAKKASLYDTGVTAQYGDQLITLSTCAYHTEDGRFAVVARKESVN